MIGYKNRGRTMGHHHPTNTPMHAGCRGDFCSRCGTLTLPETTASPLTREIP